MRAWVCAYACVHNFSLLPYCNRIITCPFHDNHQLHQFADLDSVLPIFLSHLPHYTQAIYNQQPSHLSVHPEHPEGRGANGPQAISSGGVHDVLSLSSAEMLSPDSMFTLINNWCVCLW